MKPASIILVLVGVLAAALFIAGTVVDSDWLSCITKPLPVLAMLTSVALHGQGRRCRLIMVGLALSAVGDVALDWPFDSFLVGLVSFLLGHLVYIAAFTVDVRELKLTRAIAPGVYGFAAYALLSPGLGEMSLPVLIYVLVICAMVWRAWAFQAETPGEAGKLALVGAVLFVLSDTVLAVNRFRAPLPGASYIIISLYWAGQVGIALSARQFPPFTRESPRLRDR